MSPYLFFFPYIFIWPIIAVVILIIIELIFWKKVASKGIAAGIKTKNAESVKIKEFRPSKKAIVILLIVQAFWIFFIVMEGWKYRDIPPLLVILLGFFIASVLFGVKYLSARIIITPQGILAIGLFRKTYLSWSEIKKLQLCSAILLDRPPFQFFLINYAGIYFVYGHKKRIVILPGIHRRELLAKTTIEKAKLKGPVIKLFYRMEWTK